MNIRRYGDRTEINVTKHEVIATLVMIGVIVAWVIASKVFGIDW